MKERFTVHFKASKYSNSKTLSLDSKCSETQASKVMSGAFDKSKDGPGAFNLWRLCRSMDRSLDDILPTGREAQEGRIVQRFLSEYQAGARHLSDFGDIIDSCDIYGEPKRGKCKVISLGPKSLLAVRSGRTDPAIHQNAFDAWAPERRVRVYEWQRRAFLRGHASDTEVYMGSTLINQEKSEGLILKAAGRVFLNDLEEGLLICCEHIG